MLPSFNNDLAEDIQTQSCAPTFQSFRARTVYGTRHGTISSRNTCVPRTVPHCKAEPDRFTAPSLYRVQVSMVKGAPGQR